MSWRVNIHSTSANFVRNQPQDGKATAKDLASAATLIALRMSIGKSMKNPVHQILIFLDVFHPQLMAVNWG